MTNGRDVLQELEAALDVSPSLDFEARVRERVRKESIAVPRWTWTAGAAVAATIVLAIALTPNRLAPADGIASLDEPATVAVTPSAEPGADALGFGTAPTRASARGAGGTRRPARTRKTPRVVVPTGQVTAIQRLVAEVAAGRVVGIREQPLPPAGLQVTALEAAAPIEFDPIRFTPLSADTSPDLWR